MAIHALFGGSFNPIHQGHIQLAIEVKQLLPIDRFEIIPCKQQPLKQFVELDDRQRIATIQQAIKGHSFIRLNRLEIDSERQPSYTIDTLRQLTSNSQDTFILILGSDCLSSLHHWKEWQNLLDYCHLLIVERLLAGGDRKTPAALAVQQWLKQHQLPLTDFLARLQQPQTPYAIAYTHMQSPIALSSTQLRQNQQSCSLT